MKTETQYSIEETLQNWLAEQGLDVRTLHIERRDQDGTLYFAKGVFEPCLFDEQLDGARITFQYHIELALGDERFEDTKLIFPTDQTFKIV